VADKTPYILVHLVEKRSVGERFLRRRAEWPLHITLVPWFYVEAAQEAVCIDALQRYAKHAAGFTAKVGEEITFTAPNGDKNIPVNLMADQARLRELHQGLVDIVRDCSAGFMVSKPYVGDKFRAHITHHIADGVAHRRVAGDTENIADFTLLRLIPHRPTDYCEVAEHFTLEGDHETAA
jgi:2'-5' RNA ligase